MGGVILAVGIGLLAFLASKKPARPKSWALDMQPPVAVIAAGQQIMAKYQGRMQAIPASELIKVISGTWWMFKYVGSGLATYRGIG